LDTCRTHIPRYGNRIERLVDGRQRSWRLVARFAGLVGGMVCLAVQAVSGMVFLVGRFARVMVFLVGRFVGPIATHIFG
jgi:hypothetical protein